MKKPLVLSYSLSAQRRLWSDWADVQADLSLRWVYTHFVGLSCRCSFYCINKFKQWGWARSSTNINYGSPPTNVAINIMQTWKWQIVLLSCCNNMNIWSYSNLTYYIAINIKWLKICDTSRGTSVPISLDIGTLTWYRHIYSDAFACCCCMTLL